MQAKKNNQKTYNQILTIGWVPGPLINNLFEPISSGSKHKFVHAYIGNSKAYHKIKQAYKKVI